jgi:hypothetical protein
MFSFIEVKNKICSSFSDNSFNPTYAIQSPAMHKSTNGNLCFHFMHQLCTSALNQILKISSEKLQAYS